MKNFSYKLIVLAMLLLTAGLFADSHKHKQKADIVDTAVQAGSFNTLVAAVKAAGLVETLKGNGPLTVFAPTDEAFAKLPDGVVADLLKPENREKLVAILTYHVVAGKVTADEVVNLDRANTVEGSAIKIRLDDGNVFVNNSRVVKTDIFTSNGVIHVIDEVLLPGMDIEGDASAAMDLIETAIKRGVPLYNNGQPAACAAIYEITTQALLGLDANLPRSAEKSLRKALRNSRHSDSNADRAWALRHGLDEAYASMKQMMMSSL